MKGEYREDKNPHPSSSTMFSKFQHHHNNHHHHHQQPSPPPPSQHFAITSHQFQLSNTSEEADSRSRNSTPTIKKTSDNIINNTNTTNNNDGASIEVVRRPRGRPPGSKNKPKPPVIITREPDPAMAPYVLELPGGADIVDSVVRYCKRRNMGLCVLTGSGSVTNVSLRQPTTTAAATVTFHGRFDILSLSATVLPSVSTSSGAASFANGFTISLAGPQGQIVGGAVAGPLISGGPVYIIAASFNNPMYHRLPSEEDETGGGGTGSRAGSEQSLPAVSAGGESGGGHHLPPSTTTDSMSMYSSHLPSDVIWAPTARQAPHHPPPY